MNTRGGIIRVGLMLILLGCVALVTSTVVYREDIRRFARAHVRVVPQKNSLDVDLGTLGKGHLDGTINMSVANSLPLGVTLTKLNYSVFLNDAEICSGLQAAPQALIAPAATSTVKIRFTIDTRSLRAAALKTSADQMARLGQSLLDRMKGKKPAENSLQGLLRISGRAEVQLFTDSIEIPVEFSRNL